MKFDPRDFGPQDAPEDYRIWKDHYPAGTKKPQGSFFSEMADKVEQMDREREAAKKKQGGSR